MKRKIVSIILFTVMGQLTYSNVFAQKYANRLELPEKIEAEIGTAMLQLPISMTNEVSVSGFQCDLYMPDGFTVATDEGSNYLIEIARATANSHNLAAREMSDGALRIVVTSIMSATFSGNSGAVLNIAVSVSKKVTIGNYTVNLKNIVLTDPQATRFTSADVMGTIVIKEQPVTVTAQDLTMIYGDDVPTLTYTTEGAELKGIPSLSCKATSTSPVGTYPIVVSNGTVENGSVTYVNGTLTITKAPLTIAAGTYTKKQGEAIPDFSLTYTGFKNGDTKESLIKQPTVSCEATSYSAPGEYVVTVSDAEAQNYDISYINGKLIVEKADVTGVAINETNFPDDNFRNWLLSQDYGQDGMLTQDETERITDINVSSLNIQDLKGIEYFSALEYLSCDQNMLTELDVTKNVALIKLDCTKNKLAKLDVSENAKLETLYCYENKLTTLDVSVCTELLDLSCEYNQLTEIDVSKNTALEYLDCGENIISTIDVSNNTQLVVMYCYGNQIVELDVTKNVQLTTLGCSSNKLASIDLLKNTKLSWLNCGDNQLTSLDISKNTTLTTLQCYSNGLNKLDVSNNIKLSKLLCHNNQLTDLGVSNNTALYTLLCYNNQLTTLDVSNNTALNTLYCYDNQLTMLDVSNNTALNTLYCHNNQLITLDVSGCKELRYLYSDNNQLTTLDVSNNTALNTLYCDHNQLITLDVSGCKELRYLYSNNNQLTMLDVSNNTALYTLLCYNNQLTTLDVSNNTALNTLYCYNNQLTTLDLSKNTVLSSLACFQNQINGTNMDALVGSLPDVSGYLYVLYNENEQNVMTTTQVAAAKEKGWIPCYYDGESWQKYAGSEEDPDGIESLTPALSKGEGEIYDLNGRKQSSPQKGINIIRYSGGRTRKVLTK